MTPSAPTERDRRTFAGLRRVVAILRGPEGCPWDRVQTHETLRPYLIEETAETIAALDEGDPAMLCEELGDLLWQVLIPKVGAGKVSDWEFVGLCSSVAIEGVRGYVVSNRG